MMKATALLVLGASVGCQAHWNAEHFKPLTDACVGFAEQSSCTAKFDGVCKTEEGERFCGKEDSTQEGGCMLWRGMKMAKQAVGKLVGFDDKHHHPRYLGDCGDKADGEVCSFNREGRCVDSGKCPVFQGQMVCKPWDAHPPEFITKPCEGKVDGDSCYMSLLPGTCTPRKFESGLYCKSWIMSGWTKVKEEQQQQLPSTPKAALLV